MIRAPMPAPLVISPHTTSPFTVGLTVPVSQGTTANVMWAYGITLESPCTLYNGFVVNGTAAGGNAEVALYDDLYRKIVTTGSVAGSGNSVPQILPLTDTVVGPGNFFVVVAADNNTANRYTGYAIIWTNMIISETGGWKQASITLGSLPATATPVSAGGQPQMPVCGFLTRSNFDL